MSVSVELNTPLAEALNNVVQPKLVEVGWSTGGGDDSALAEYIILMLVNKKTQEQIAAELANDLLGLGPDDTEAVDFSRWLFEQVDALDRQLNGGGQPVSEAPEQHDQQNTAQAIPSLSETNERDGMMGEGIDMEMGDGNVPTGPRTMRNQRQNGRGRLPNHQMSQISKAMDRTNESVLHRVRNHAGSGRVDTHNREPPRGPRNFQNRGGRNQPGRQMGAMGMNNMMGGMGPNPMQNMPAGGNMSHQQQMQMMQMFEEQARMMAQLMPGFVPPAINPAFQQNQQQGRSLFDRAEYQPNRNQNQFQRRGPHHNNFNRPPPPESKEVEMGGNENADKPGAEGQQGESTERPFEQVCRFNLRCTNKDCPFAHQSPVAPEGIAVDLSDTCSFGAACKNRKCVGRHPSPAVKTSHQTETLCRFFPHCNNPHCSFKHPDMPLCRNGADCTVEGCKFTHIQTPCKFNPCLNRACTFKHAEGQKGAFTDKVWRAGDPNRPHVSERKFTDAENGEEELIKPGQGVVDGAQSESQGQAQPEQNQQDEQSEQKHESHEATIST